MSTVTHDEMDAPDVPDVQHEPPSPLDQSPPADHDTSNSSSKGKFVEVLSPSPSILSHPQSQQWPDLRGGLAPGEDDEEDDDDNVPEPGLLRPKVNLEQRIADGSSLFGTEDNNALFEIGRYRATMAGFIVSSYTLPGNEYRAALREQSLAEEVKSEYASLWLQLQLFWDEMVRTQPNPVTDDPAELAHAVDLMADVAAGRLIADKPDYPAERALCVIKELRRRLQRLELVLKTAVSACGEPPKLHGGCIAPLALKRGKDKTTLWSRLFDAGASDAHVSEDRQFRIRDVACLLRLEDFLTHVSREFEGQLNRRPEPESLVMTAISFMEKPLLDILDGGEIRTLLGGDEIRTLADLKSAWVYLLCSATFRGAVAREIQNMVSDAVAFRKKHGHGQHREGCDRRVGKAGGGGFIKQLSFSNLAAEARPRSKSSPLRAFFKKA
ncbi:hypothetical protein QQZ08_011282 [Neonectria magnoliae]|uniref:Uncharacterized protein n=1 Tax=Neonectria magnoliae TaxID=2732573 RepID=A0ABR1HBW1_9HYPO